MIDWNYGEIENDKLQPSFTIIWHDVLNASTIREQLKNTLALVDDGKRLIYYRKTNTHWGFWEGNDKRSRLLIY